MPFFIFFNNGAQAEVALERLFLLDLEWSDANLDPKDLYFEQVALAGSGSWEYFGRQPHGKTYKAWNSSTVYGTMPSEPFPECGDYLLEVYRDNGNAAFCAREYAIKEAAAPRLGSFEEDYISVRGWVAVGRVLSHAHGWLAVKTGGALHVMDSNEWVPRGYFVGHRGGGIWFGACSKTGTWSWQQMVTGIGNCVWAGVRMDVTRTNETADNVRVWVSLDGTWAEEPTLELNFTDASPEWVPWGDAEANRVGFMYASADPNARIVFDHIEVYGRPPDWTTLFKLSYDDSIAVLGEEFSLLPTSRADVISYTLVSGSLPDGITLDEETGEISGILTAEGLLSLDADNLIVRATYPGGSIIDSNPFTIAVKSPISHIAGLTLHLDAGNDYGRLVLVEDKISQWLDISGNENHFSQSAPESRPTTLDGESGINGRRVVRMNGVNEFLAGGGPISNLITADQHTIFAVAAYHNVQGGDASWVYRNDALYQDVNMGGGSGSGAFIGLEAFTTPEGIKLSSHTYDGSSRGDHAIHEYIFLNTPFLSQSKHDGGVLYHRVNGASEVTNPNAGNISSLANTLLLGRNYYQPRYSNISIASLIIFDRALSPEEIDEVRAYLSDRWGISVEP